MSEEDLEWLGRTLRLERDLHEPDVRVIRERVGQARRGRIRRGGLRERRWLPRPRAALVLAAACTVTGTGVAAMAVAAGRLPGAASGQVRIVGAASGTATATPTIGKATNTGAASATSASTNTSTAVGGARPSPPRTAPTGAGVRVITMDVVPLSAGAAVLVSHPGDVDWLVVGARGDGKVVVAKRPATPGGARITVKAGATAAGATGPTAPAVTPGPFVIAWQGGVPEQDRTGDTTWSSVDAATNSLQVSATVGPAGADLVIYLGATAGGVRVSASAAGSTAVAVEVPSGVGPVQAAVTVHVAPGAAGREIVVQITGLRSPAGARLGVAAVRVR